MLSVTRGTLNLIMRVFAMRLNYKCISIPVLKVCLFELQILSYR